MPLHIQTLVAAILVGAGAGRRVGATLGPGALIPDARFSLRNFIEIAFEGIASLGQDVMGHDWKKFMPLVGTLGIFILVSNLMGIIPGLGGPTSYIETNLAWAILSVTTAEIATIRVQGVVGWAKHMAPGPLWLAPLLFPIEVFSHLLRYVSLTIRLTANMFADHTLLAIFLSGFGVVVATIFPWLILALGLFVCIAFIFAFSRCLHRDASGRHWRDDACVDF